MRRHLTRATRRECFSEPCGKGADLTQSRLRKMAEILNQTEPRFGPALMACALVSLRAAGGLLGLAAMQLVQAGRATEVTSSFDAPDAGIFAGPLDYSGLL